MRMRDGSFGSSVMKSWDRLAEYIELARKDPVKGSELLKALDRNTLDSDVHPNAVLFCAVVMLHLMEKTYPGLSPAEVARRLGDKWRGESLAENLGLVIPN